MFAYLLGIYTGGMFGGNVYSRGDFCHEMHCRVLSRRLSVRGNVFLEDCLLLGGGEMVPEKEEMYYETRIPRERI